jgi:glycine/D-amino acid oxidase-like deaminating enzyme
MVHYAQISVDGRIVFGRGGGALGPAGRVVARHFRNERAIAAIAADFRRWFPALADARLTHAWGGAVDRAPGHLPFTGTLGDHDELIYGCGFSGNGVAPSAFIGSLLARQALGTVDADTRSPIAAGPPALLPPEPLRTGGGTLVRALVERSERAEEQGRPAVPKALLRRLITVTVPPPLEPRRFRRAA